MLVIDGDVLGKHVLARLEGIPFEKLDNQYYLYDISLKAIEEAKMHVETHCVKRFSPQGITLLILLSESHLAIHTWPEKGIMALECFTCGDEGDPVKAVNFFLEILNPTTTKLEVVTR